MEMMRTHIPKGVTFRRGFAAVLRDDWGMYDTFYTELWTEGGWKLWADCGCCDTVWVWK